MKNKIIIILVITIIIALIIVGINFLNKEEEEKLTVALFYTGTDLEYDLENCSYKYHEIELTSKQEEKIIEFYNKLNTKQKQDTQLAIIGTIKLEFSDGNKISIDNNNDLYGYINNEYCIRLSREFKEYILKIID